MRRTISLLAEQSDPRITEWPMPGTVKSEALPLYLCAQLKKGNEGNLEKYLKVLDKGHFITGSASGSN